MPRALNPADAAELSGRWRDLCLQAELRDAAPELYNTIVQAYGQPNRHYHDIGHIIDCLRQFDELQRHAGSPEAVGFAIWLHDVVYDTHKTDNEEASASLAYNQLRRAGSRESLAAHVRNLVLATRHAPGELADPDARLLVDVDLSILGQPPEVFDQYEEAVRLEYDWVPESFFWARRSEILASFLAREAIYHHPTMRARFETTARRNLERAIARAQSRCGA